MPNGTLNVYLASNHNDLTILDRARLVSNSYDIISLFKTQSKSKAGGCQRWTSLPWVSADLPWCSNCSLPLMQVHSIPVMHGDITGVNLELLAFLKTHKYAGKHTDRQGRPCEAN
jgi:hypothetical protein